MVTQDPRAGYRVALWQATNAMCIWGAAKLGFQPLSSASRIDFAIPCSGPESGSLAEEAAAGHWALQVPAQLPQPLGRVCCLHPGCTHQSGASPPCTPWPGVSASQHLCLILTLAHLSRLLTLLVAPVSCSLHGWPWSGLSLVVTAPYPSFYAVHSSLFPPNYFS